MFPIFRPLGFRVPVRRQEVQTTYNQWVHTGPSALTFLIQSCLVYVIVSLSQGISPKISYGNSGTWKVSNAKRSKDEEEIKHQSPLFSSLRLALMIDLEGQWNYDRASRVLNGMKVFQETCKVGTLRFTTITSFLKNRAVRSPILLGRDVD